MLLITVAGANAGVIDWDGEAGDGDFRNPLNWENDNLPKNNDYSDDIRFGSTSAEPGFVTLSGDRRIDDIIFTSAGWTLDGGRFLDNGNIRSAGAGTNRITTTLNQKGGGDWIVSAGNTLIIEDLYQRAANNHLVGGGTVRFTNAIGGFGGSPGSFGFRLQEITAVFENAAIYAGASGGAVFIDDAKGILQVRSTIDDVQAKIGSRIVDNVGNGLQVVDLGNGYIEVSVANVIPEPTVIAATLALGGFGLTKRRLLGQN